MDERLRKRIHRQRFTVGLDEGGLRCRSSKLSVYVPYDAIVDADLGSTFFGHTCLVLDVGTEGGAHREVRLELANGNPFDVLGAVLAHVSQPHASSRAPVLRRASDPIDAWLARVRSMALGEGTAGYRKEAAMIDATTLAAILEDANAASEERAAAAHALLEIGTDDALACVTRVLVTRAVPPIVLVATHLARAGTALVDDELFAEMIAFCVSDDEARAFKTRPDEEQAQRVAASLARATEEAAAALDAAAAGARGRKVHSLPAGGRLDGARWVGKSWAL